MAVLLLDNKVEKLAERDYNASIIVDADYQDILVTVSDHDNVLSFTLKRREAEYLRNFLTAFLKEKQNI